MIRKPDPMDFAQRLNEACEIIGWPKRGRAATFARKLNVSGPTAHAWVTGKHMPEPERVREMARFMGVRYEWLYFGDGELVDGRPERTEEEWQRLADEQQAQAWSDFGLTEVPVWSAFAAAGSGAINGDLHGPKGSILFRERSLEKKGIRQQTSHVCYVQGESMVPRLRDGDAVLFDASDKTVRAGKVYVIRKGDETFVKRLYREGSRYRVVSDNKADPQWQDWFVEADDPDFEIIGRVRWVGSWEE